MIQFLFRDILRPLSQRAATALGAALTAQGMAVAEADQVVAALPLLLGFGFDLLIRRLY